MERRSHLTEQDMREFEPEAKIGLLATVSPEGLPHVTLITTLQAKSPTQLIWGQFCEGLSKEHVRSNPKVAFLVLNQKRELWRGRATWTGAAREGADYERLNQLPMFRYNSYFGIHTVHGMDLTDTTGRETLCLPCIAAGTLCSAIARRVTPRSGEEPALKPWAEAHMNKLDTLKFFSITGTDGYPEIIPAVPCQAVDRRRLVFSPTVYERELRAIPVGATLAVFALNLQTESVLIRGTFTGYRGIWPLRVGIIDVSWVYNSMPPKQGQIYPPIAVEAVTTF